MSERRPSARDKRVAAERAGRRCEYCRSPIDFCPDPFSLEHIIPRVEGGSHSLSNLAFSCLGCNNFKHTHTRAVDTATGEIVRLYHPRRDRWAAHFGWSEEFTLIVGHTPIGRATIQRLQLNRPGVINLRRVLLHFNEHPPSDPDDPIR